VAGISGIQRTVQSTCRGGRMVWGGCRLATSLTSAPLPGGRGEKTKRPPHRLPVS
jgi:hypothetical protein